VQVCETLKTETGEASSSNYNETSQQLAVTVQNFDRQSNFINIDKCSQLHTKKRQNNMTLNVWDAIIY